MVMTVLNPEKNKFYGSVKDENGRERALSYQAEAEALYAKMQTILPEQSRDDDTSKPEWLNDKPDEEAFEKTDWYRVGPKTQRAKEDFHEAYPAPLAPASFEKSFQEGTLNPSAIYMVSESPKHESYFSFSYATALEVIGWAGTLATAVYFLVQGVS